MEKAIKESFTVPGSPSRGLSEGGGGGGVEGDWQLICSKRWIYLPDKLEWRCEMPDGVHISLFLGRGQRYRDLQ